MVEDSGLRGRGGATFPTGMKFRLTSKSEASQKYMICNADESEPGTFKDRYLMEICPDLVVEGTAIAAYAIGATQAYIFIRGEYPLSATRLQQAIDRARDGGYLGEDILGSGYDLDIEIRRGAGAYICGDETALMEAIEGKRGFPRIKPPYPTTHGLFGKPTACNNVETLCNLPLIVERGVDWFRSMGTEESTGSKLISISGHVNRPGVYEIELGMTLRDLLEGPCGGGRRTVTGAVDGRGCRVVLDAERNRRGALVRGTGSGQEYLRGRGNYGVQRDSRYARGFAVGGAFLRA
jgi:NADH:ubiquinone oxidoreductase subunit F (NADH-binding)